MEAGDIFCKQYWLFPPLVIASPQHCKEWEERIREEKRADTSRYRYPRFRFVFILKIMNFIED